MITMGVLGLCLDSGKIAWASFAFIGLGNLLLGIIYKNPSNVGKWTNLSYVEAAASLVGILLFGISWFSH